MLFRDLNDFREQISTWSISSTWELMSKIPGMGPLGMEFPFCFDLDKENRRMLGTIDGMTPAERRNPAMIDGQRRRRIAAGSGVEHADVCRLLDLFDEIAAQLEKLARARLSERFRTSTGFDDVEFDIRG